MPGMRYLPYNFVEGRRIDAVQRVDGHVAVVATAAKAKLAQDTDSHNRATHASPDDMPYATLPDFSRLCLHLLQHGIICEQALHTFDPIKLERPILTAQSCHEPFLLTQLPDRIIVDQLLKCRRETPCCHQDLLSSGHSAITLL